jgi:antitoxin component of RelBE/YafQ-DinJ toxin-antitoxin module
MMSKLTLHLDEDVKARAEEIARERGTSVSVLVENYLKRLRSKEGRPADEGASAELTPRLETVHEQIGPPPEEAPFDAPQGDLTADERDFVKAASKKYT